MATGAITEYVDVAQLVLYAFWVFFAALVYYLTVESKREGFPLEYDVRGETRRAAGIAGMPEPKTFHTEYWGDVTVPKDEPLEKVAARPSSYLNGAPLVPTGNPMLDGVGPGAFTKRADIPDMTSEGQKRILPGRLLGQFTVAKQDKTPVGMEVMGDDGLIAGTVKELWIDQAEVVIRYFEIETLPEFGSRRVLLPMNFSRIHRDYIKVESILANQFALVPGLRSQDQITLLEEEKIMAYFGGGTLYATPERQEPLI
jgi:photosynthetic reaction center H subunit